MLPNMLKGLLIVKILYFFQKNDEFMEFKFSMILQFVLGMSIYLHKK